MALHFHKKPIMINTTSLKNLTARYREYTAKVNYPTIDEDSYEDCRSAIALLQSGIRQMREGKEQLQTLYNEIRDEYKNCKNKSERKDLMLEIEQIEEDSQLQVVIGEANDLIYMLTTRLDESKSMRDKMDVKLGYVTQRAQRSENTDNLDTQDGQDDVSEQTSANNDSERVVSQTSTSSVNHERNDSAQNHYRSIKPPQASLPKFHGNAEDFPEYWAIFETLVHKSKELDVMEKILLLKESLKGRAQTAIKGIRLVPENYDWIIKTLQRNYCDQPTNRSQIVQKLVNLKPAYDSADSCMAVFDQIHMLINYMVSAGYDVRNTNDPMWCETILAKFPRDIVKPVLVSGQMKSTQTIEDVMANLKSEIAAKSYVENRLGSSINNRVTTTKEKNTLPRAHYNDQCLFCQRPNHSSWACRTVTDQNSRRKVLKDQNRCWKCGSAAHNSFDCRKPDCSQCGQKHHSSICSKKESLQPRAQTSSWNQPPRNNTGQSNTRFPNTNHRYQRNSNGQNDRRGMTTNSTHMATETSGAGPNQQNIAASQLVLMTAEGNVWNYNKNEFEKVLFFFDSGAHKTVVEESLADQLGLPKTSTEICTMSGIGGHIENFRSHIVGIRLSTAFGEEVELSIQTKPVITNGFPSVKLSKEDITFLKSNNICLANSKLRGEHQKPHILVGLDYYHELVGGPNDVIKTPTGLRVAGTIFGPTLYGKGTTSEQNSREPICFGLTAVHENSEQEILHKMFELEGLGISSQECQKEDKAYEYLEQYSKQISYENGHITAPFPLKDNISDLEDNRSVAIRRLESLQKVLRGNSEQCQWYCKILQKYEQEGMIETFSVADEQAVGTYYMPHSGVWRPSKKVPLRIVFDASSKMKGKPSLNDVIHKGESFVNRIHDILVTSRMNKIVLMCDIEAAFTQIRLVNSHKDLCRFLWVKNIHLPPTKDNLICYRFRRLPFGITACPSILNMALMTYLKEQRTDLANEIMSNIYVDNILLCAETTTEAVEKYRASKTLLQKIGMNLREYISNSAEVNEWIKESDKLETSSLKLLGVNYNVKTDLFKIVRQFSSFGNLTKKDVVSQINSVFDPIGFAGPLLVELKSMMREIFDTGADWKTHLSPEINSRWNQLCAKVNNAVILVPRPILINSGSKLRMWVFADASKFAIAACAYVQCTASASISTLISGKTRLTPKKTRQTIPRLELVGMLMAARLCWSILSTMRSRIAQISIVSDSEIALWWLKSPKKVPIFVENQRERILAIKSQIQESGIPLNFFHVDTDHNPADAGTRGLVAKEINDHDWINGPRWLENSPNTWPLKSMDAVEESYIEEVPIQTISAANIEKPKITASKEKLLDLSRFSRMNKALRVQSLVGKTAKNWVSLTNKNQTKSNPINLEVISNYDSTSEITSNDIEISEQIIICQEQKDVDLLELQKRFRDKRIICDKNGVIRHESRLQNAAIPYDTKSPIFIPENSELIRLIVQKIHIDNAHCGKDHVLAIARQKFWIPRASNAFKKFVKTCVTCKRYQGLPLGAPIMPSLPVDRVISSKPFENVGCDFMGPFTSKSQEKFYVCLYTCLTTRAVHLEVVENMSTSAFLSSFVRFTSRRGVPKIVRTDCGTNFKHGERIIATMFEKDDETGNSLMSYSASEKIRWIFNPPGAPWMGGAWERLVGAVKKALNKSIGRKRLNFTEMTTVITRIEAIINTRPLTKVSLDDLTEIPLRPIDFLQGNVKFSLPLGHTTEEFEDPSFDPDFIQSSKQALEAIRFSEEIANKFWESWRTQYLVSLRESQKMNLKQPRHLNRSIPVIGEIVLIEQDLIPRGNWPYGKVLEIITSTDGRIRSAKVLMPNHNVIHRPLNKIFPLEIRSFPEETSPSVQVTNDLPTAPERRQILSRVSKTKAYEVIKDFESSLENSQASVSLSTPMMLVMILSLISPSLAVNVTQGITCSKGKVDIAYPSGSFELCFEEQCRNFSQTSHSLNYMLPIAPDDAMVTVKLTPLIGNNGNTQIMKCERPPYCDHQYLLSKSLLGNPHCWPIGALGTAAFVIYAALTISLLISFALTKSIKKCQNHRINSEQKTTSIPHSQGRICSFKLTPLPGAKSISMVAVLCAIISATNACQHGYTRHTADLVCNEQNACHYEYSRELLFNKVHSELCIELTYLNKTIGSIKIFKKPVEFKCTKIIESFTRSTRVEIHHVTRCAQAGSCTESKCQKMKSNETIPELKPAMKYPGYTGCLSNCGGIACGCFLPIPACTFYKVAHKPISKRIFEIVKCPHWTPTISLDIEVTILGKNKTIFRKIRPYIKEDIDLVNITAISLQKPSNAIINKRFAISENISFILPDGYRIPVECRDAEQASKAFSSCMSRVRCECGSSVHQCQCPEDSINDLHVTTQAYMPQVTPYGKIIQAQNDILAISNEEELILRVESKILKNSASLIINQKCDLQVSKVSGCYNCPHGAEFNVNCSSSTPAVVTVTCDSHRFTLRCNSSKENNWVLLNFEKANVHERCAVHCAENPEHILLEGTLLYHISTPNVSIFENDVHGVPLKHQWFTDVSLPDFEPLIKTVKNHWKLALGAFGSALGLAAITYIAGPMVLIYIAKLVFFIITSLAKMAWTIASTCLSLLCTTMKKSAQ